MSQTLLYEPVAMDREGNRAVKRDEKEYNHYPDPVEVVCTRFLSHDRIWQVCHTGTASESVGETRNGNYSYEVRWEDCFSFFFSLSVLMVSMIFRISSASGELMPYFETAFSRLVLAC